MDKTTKQDGNADQIALEIQADKFRRLAEAYDGLLSSPAVPQRVLTVESKYLRGVAARSRDEQAKAEAAERWRERLAKAGTLLRSCKPLRERAQRVLPDSWRDALEPDSDCPPEAAFIGAVAGWLIPQWPALFPHYDPSAAPIERLDPRDASAIFLNAETCEAACRLLAGLVEVEARSQDGNMPVDEDSTASPDEQSQSGALADQEEGDVYPSDQIVTLRQAAGACGLSKRTLEEYKRLGQIPPPDFPGDKGKAHHWYWPNLKPALEDITRRPLPDQFHRIR